MIKSKADVDRIRQTVGKRRATLSKVRQIVAMYRQGKAASSCMAEIELAIADCDRNLNQRDGVK